jgi:hypothetical protein
MVLAIGWSWAGLDQTTVDFFNADYSSLKCEGMLVSAKKRREK